MCYRVVEKARGLAHVDYHASLLLADTISFILSNKKEFLYDCTCMLLMRPLETRLITSQSYYAIYYQNKHERNNVFVNIMKPTAFIF